MSAPLLQIQNRHTPECGDPPIVDGGSDNKYIGYFENQFGEQWVFTRDRNTGIAILRGGDAGWDNQYDVTDGNSGLRLTPEERLWLQACSQVSQHRKLEGQ